MVPAPSTIKSHRQAAMPSAPSMPPKMPAERRPEKAPEMSEPEKSTAVRRQSSARVYQQER